MRIFAPSHERQELGGFCITGEENALLHEIQVSSEPALRSSTRDKCHQESGCVLSCLFSRAIASLPSVQGSRYKAGSHQLPLPAHAMPF